MPVALDSWTYDPEGFLPGYTAPNTNTSYTGSFNDYGGGFDWGGFTTNVMKLLPNIISAGKGNPYASGAYGQSSYPQAGGAGGGQGVYAGGSFLGASGFGQISGTTMILIGLGVFLLLRRK